MLISRAIFLEMDGLIISSHTSFLKGFRKSGVGVASSGDIFSGGTVFNTEDGFSNHFTSVGANDVDTEDSVSLLISQDLDETISIDVSLCSRVGNEGEVTLSVFNT